MNNSLTKCINAHNGTPVAAYRWQGHSCIKDSYTSDSWELPSLPGEAPKPGKAFLRSLLPGCLHPRDCTPPHHHHPTRMLLPRRLTCLLDPIIHHNLSLLVKLFIKTH